MNLPLRILYSINGSQYILARSVTQFPAVLVPHGQSTTLGVDYTSSEPNHQPRYAMASLKACLNTICRSSPELIQDSNRDYTVYVLDPLESHSAPAPVHISNSAAAAGPSKQLDNQDGVAVGLGLMSWGLQASDSDVSMVVGTVIKPPTGQEALEIILALRETTSMRQNSLQEAVHSWGSNTLNSMGKQHASSSSEKPSITSKISVTRTTSTMRMQHSSVPLSSKPSKPAQAPLTDSERLMLSSETYFGPQKKKGRPKGSGKDVNRNKSMAPPPQPTSTPHSASSAPPGLGPSSQPLNSASTSQPPFSVSQPSTTVGVTPTAATTSNSAFQDILGLFIGAPSADPSNTALLAALGSIDSPSATPSENGAALVSALKQLLTACAQSQEQPVSQPVSTNSAGPDEEVVLLDKENVNPTAFRRRMEKEIDGPKAQPGMTTTATSGSVPVPLSASRSSERIGLSLSHRSNENSPPVPASRTVHNSNGGHGVKRKRTLSEFMDERESSRGRAQEKERGRRSHASTKGEPNSAEQDRWGLRHYPRLMSEAPLRQDRSGLSHYQTGMEPWSSPPRSRSDKGAEENSRANPIVIPNSPGVSRTSASSPVRLSSKSKARKPYVVPEWARTGTATLPRLSEAAQRAMEEAEERKKDEMKKDRSKRRTRSLNPTTTQRTEPSGSSQPVANSATPSSPLLGPVSASSDFDVFSSEMDCLPSQQINSSRSSSPSLTLPSENINTPRTPPRRGSGGLRLDEARGSLFTPTPKSRGTLRLAAGSPLFSPEGVFGPFPSPLTARMNSPMSPVRSFPKRKSLDRLPSSSSSSQSRSQKTRTSAEEDEEDFLTRELDDALDDLDLPPSSLPIASSDIDEAMLPPPAEREDDPGEESETEGPPQVKQHWQGLPPSSPPPPSSPMLAPEDGSQFPENDDFSLPEATPEAEDSPSDTPVDLEDEQALTDDELAAYFVKEVLGSGANQGESTDNSASADDWQNGLDIFQQFTHQNSEPDLPAEDAAEQSFTTDSGEIDFSAFWESFKPLVHDNMFGTTGGGDDGSDAFNIPKLDHEKLAGEVHALFSGCLM